MQLKTIGETRRTPLQQTVVFWNLNRDANDRPATRSTGLHFLIPLIIFHLYSNLVTYWKTYHADWVRTSFH